MHIILTKVNKAHLPPTEQISLSFVIEKFAQNNNRKNLAMKMFHHFLAILKISFPS